MSVQRLAIAAFAALLATSAVFAAHSVSAQSPVPQGDVKHGQALYTGDGCYLCHDYNGLGSGRRGPGQWPAPNLAPAPVPYAAFISQLRKPRAEMPAYDAKILPDRDAADIYAYLESIPPAKDPSTIALLGMVDTGPPGAAGSGAAGRGRTIFAQNCAACHGATGAGGIGPSLLGESAKLNLAATIAIVKNPPAGMTKLYPGLIDENDVNDVAAYVQTLK